MHALLAMINWLYLPKLVGALFLQVVFQGSNCDPWDKVEPMVMIKLDVAMLTIVK